MVRSENYVDKPRAAPVKESVKEVRLRQGGDVIRLIVLPYTPSARKCSSWGQGLVQKMGRQFRNRGLGHVGTGLRQERPNEGEESIYYYLT